MDSTEAIEARALIRAIDDIFSDETGEVIEAIDPVAPARQTEDNA